MGRRLFETALVRRRKVSADTRASSGAFSSDAICARTVAASAGALTAIWSSSPIAVRRAIPSVLHSARRTASAAAAGERAASSRSEVSASRRNEASLSARATERMLAVVPGSRLLHSCRTALRTAKDWSAKAARKVAAWAPLP